MNKVDGMKQGRYDIFTPTYNELASRHMALNTLLVLILFIYLNKSKP